MYTPGTGNIRLFHPVERFFDSSLRGQSDPFPCHNPVIYALCNGAPRSTVGRSIPCPAYWFPAERILSSRSCKIVLTYQVRTMFKETVICLLALSVLLCGCTSTPAEKTGAISVTSTPPGAEIYLNNEYRGTTPATISAAPVGNHTIELRERGYKTWSGIITVTAGTTVSASSALVPLAVTTPTPAPAATTPAATIKAAPEIHVDGYWTYPAVRSFANPIVLFVHAEGANVGNADARVVTSSANLYYYDQQICWTRIYFGTIKAGGHATKDTMMSCHLPAGADDHDFIIRFENIIVTP